MARKLVVLAPTNELMAGSSATLMARLWSDGAAWTGAAPKLVMQGPVRVEFADLHDDGSNGDGVGGDGIYSQIVTLPPQPGGYTVFATAEVTDDGAPHQIRSADGTIGLVGNHLDFGRSGNRLILSWPTNGVGFRLESSVGFTNAPWSGDALTPVVVGDRNLVTNLIANEARFYRLRWP